MLSSSSFPRQSLTALHIKAMHFIDIAANLTDQMYSGVYNNTQRHPPDLPQVIARAREAGIVKTLVTAGTLSQSVQAQSLCVEYPSLFHTVGVHPTRAAEIMEDPSAHCDKLLQIAQRAGGKVVAIGECGLDYDRTHFCAKDLQMPGFIAQFQLAQRTQLPMFLHDRNTGGDFLRVVTENRACFTTGVVHSFTGTQEEMLAYVQLGLYIGINGCSLKTQDNIEVVKNVPLDRLMLETDCPYCEIRSTHAGFGFVESKWQARDKKKYSANTLVKGRSEPCQIRQICEVVAAAKGVSNEDIARAAFNNTMRVFFPDEATNMGISPYDLSVSAISSQHIT